MHARTVVIVIAAALLVLGSVGVGAYRVGLQTVDQAPDFTLTSTGYENGTEGEPVTFSLADYRNKTVLIDFMAVSCTSCRIVTEHVLRPLHAELGNRSDFVILSIDAWAKPDPAKVWPGETREELVGLQKEEGVPWRHALDTDDVVTKYQAQSLPKLVVVGPEGQIVKEWGIGSPSLGKVRAAVLDGIEGDAAAGTVWRAPPGFVLGATALVAGVASFFAPCSVGLVPAYLGVLMRGPGRAGGDTRPAVRAALTLRAGALTGLGMISVYAVIAAVLWSVEAAGHGAAVRAALPMMVPVMAVVLIAMGILMFVGVGWDWITRHVGNRVDGQRGFIPFGAAYGLAAFGCTGPVFLPVLLAGFAHGAATGLLVMLVYAGALAGFLMLAAAFVAAGHVSRLRGLLSHTQAISRISAVLLVAAGLILLWTDWQAGVIG